MIDFPTEREAYDRLGATEEFSDYRERIDNTISYKAVGVGGPIFLVQTHEFDTDPASWKRNLEIMREGYRICGLIGLNMRIVDDLLDGDGVTAVEDREQFAENYIESVEVGEMPDIHETRDERIAYCAGRIINDHFEDPVLDDIKAHLDEMKDLVKEEDKSTEAGYRRYAQGAAAENAQLMITAMQAIKGYEPTDKDYEFAKDYGLSTQIADDKFDDDLELDEEVVDRLYEEFLNDLLEHEGVVPQTIGNLGLKVPQIYDGLMAAGKLLDELR